MGSFAITRLSLSNPTLSNSLAQEKIKRTATIHTTTPKGVVARISRKGYIKMATNQDLGISVPSVKELAKENLTTIPRQYVRDDSSLISNGNPLVKQELPVIDMERIFSQEFGNLELEKFDKACKEWGFFQLTNHGVSNKLLDEIKIEIAKFFDLPLEEKKKFLREPGDFQGFGQHFVFSKEQKLEWADLFSLTTRPFFMRKPRFFEQFSPSFRDSIEAYSAEMQSLTLKLLGLMSKTLNMDPKDVEELLNAGTQSLRMNCYPPCPQPELAVGLNSHSDLSCLTILLHINDVEGLEVKKDGMWVPVKPIPNAFVINIGDSLEIVTNGTYRSVDHRAKVNKTSERLSLATFVGAKPDGVLKPAPSLVTPDNPAMFREISVMDFLKLFHSRQLQGKSMLDVLKIQNEVTHKSD